MGWSSKYNGVMAMIIGIDDVTRCPVIGSLIVTGVVVKENMLEALQRIGVRDSKLLTHSKIMKITPVIQDIVEDYKAIYIKAPEISKSNKQYNLNDMECNAFCTIVKEFEAKYPIAQVQINNFDYSREKFIERAEKLGFHFDWSKWVIDHENETRDIPVGAASIIGKSLSIKEYENLKKKYGDFGSGNPGDPKTIEFVKQKLREKRKCNIIRYNWATVKRLAKSI